MNNEIKKIKHIGVYGIIKDNDKILLINKVGGPYDGLLDLPGGTIEFGEKIEDALIREIKEETGLDVINYKLKDIVSFVISFEHKGSNLINHIGIIYEINKYSGDVLINNNINDTNDDSKGCKFYNIKELNSETLSKLVKETLKIK